MIYSCVYDSHQAETDQLHTIIKDLAATLTEECWDIKEFHEASALLTFLQDKPLVDIFLYDVMREGDIQRLLELREQYQLSFVMLLAEATLSPMQYIRPGINAQSLLLRPFSKQQACDALQDFIKGYVQTVLQKNKKDDASLLINSADGKVHIPYNQIYFIEALEKKVFACTGIDEYGFYDTLDNLCERLPDNFVRSHRSFIVNTDKIKKISLSRNVIYLEDEYEVPLSRSYKATIKGLENGK